MEETNELSNNGKESEDNTAEQHELLLMRAYVESHDPSSKVLSSVFLYFLFFFSPMFPLPMKKWLQSLGKSSYEHKQIWWCFQKN